MQVAQSLRGEFTKEGAVISGEAAKLPNTELSGDLGDCRARRISGFESSPHLVECPQVQISHWRCAEVLLKRIAKSSLRNTSRGGELFHGKEIAVMLFDKIHGHVNDVFSRDCMPANRVFGFARFGEHVANRSD